MNGSFVFLTLFWLGILATLYSYVLYPALIDLLARDKRFWPEHWPEGRPLPRVTLLMAVHNEEAVLPDKFARLDELDYPPELLHIYIGSDASTDATNALSEAYAAERGQVRFFAFRQRRGKASILNDLAKAAIADCPAGPQHIFLITDANVMPEPNAVRELVATYAHPEIGLAEARLIPLGRRYDGISRSEREYIRREARLKYREGLLGGVMAGPFGGWYSLRSDFFCLIPPHHLVDDFYLAMCVFERGGKAVANLDARVYETVSHEIGEEFKRKLRIGAGNYQNLFRFWRMWFPPFNLRAWVLFSHKVLRWLIPLLLLLSFASAVVLWWMGMSLYGWAALGMLLLFAGLPLLDMLLNALGIHVLLLRNVHYFTAMNAALLLGFLRYLRGIKQGVWQPTKRI